MYLKHDDEHMQSNICPNRIKYTRVHINGNNLFGRKLKSF